MSANQIVLRVIEVLEQQSFPYMLVGSYSSNAFGIGRSTQDADFVVEFGDRPVSTLLDALGPELVFDPQMRMENVTGTLRYVGKHNSGFKIELFLTSSDAHDRERFRRRKKQPFLTASAYLPSVEDVIIQKLRWFERSKRAKDLDDVRNVMAVQTGKLDLDYIRLWCDQHGTRSLFEQLLVESRRFEPEQP